MPNFFGSVRLCAVCLMGLAHLSPVAAQLSVDQTAGGLANIYNLDRDTRVGGVEIHGPIDKAVASQAVKLIRSIRPDVDELTVFLNSRGGDVLAAIELGEEVRKQWAWTAVDDDRECVGACVLVRRAAGFLRAGTSAAIGGLGSTVASAVVGVGFSATVLRTLDELSTNKHIVRASETDANGRAR